MEKINNSIKFRSMWSNPHGIVESDCSNEFAEIFEEVPAFTIDPQTGKFLNETSQPKIISKGKVNIQEKIQSFAREVDLYSILEKFAYSDDESLLRARPCDYGDISNFPNDLNGYAQFVNAHFDKLNEINPELAHMIIDDNVKPEDIEKKANEIYQLRIDDFEKNNMKVEEK